MKILSNNIVFLKFHSFFFLNRDKTLTYRVEKEISRLSKLSVDKIQIIQERELVKILQHAYTTTPYYKRLFDNHQIDTVNWTNFKQIPILNKTIIKNNKHDLISSKFDIKYLAKRFTGGSTGQPMEFYANKMAMISDNAHHWKLYHAIGYQSDETILGFYGRKLPERLIKKNVYWDEVIGDNVFGNYVFSSFYFNDRTAKFYAKKIITLRPAIMRGYPSFLNSLAIYFINNNIRLSFKVRGIVLTAEFCSDLQKNNIEKAFNSKVYLEYGHKEISILCHTSTKSDHYFSEPFYCYLEVLDDDGSETPIGKVGRLVTTGFNNYGMPFIRYDTGDLGELVSRAGGIVTLSQVMGRSQDYIIDKNKLKHNLIATIYRYNINAFKKIKRWQIRQDVPGEITLIVIPSSNFTKMDEQEILNSVELFKSFKVEFKYVNDIPKSRIGKHLAVIQNIQ